MTCIRKESGFGSINFGQRFGTLPFCRIGAHVGQTGADLAGQQIDEFPIDIVKRTIGIESNDDGAHRLWSLWRILTEIDIPVFAFNLRELQRLKSVYECWGYTGQLDEKFRDSMIKSIDELIAACKAADFTGPIGTLVTSREWFASTLCKGEGVPNELGHILDSVLDELYEREFYRLDRDRAAYFNKSQLWGDAVDAAFPSARFDIQEAGNCLATNRETAAVFHLMRTVEWGLRALCVSLGFRKLRIRFKRSGRTSYVPIEYLEWEKILDQLNDLVDAKLIKMRKGPGKQKLQEFYYPALQDIRAIRDAWRNHVMHTRAQYTKEDSTAIYSHVKRLMMGLASEVKEV